MYFREFGGNLSSSQTTWGAFGDFISGTIGTVFSLVSVIFSIGGIYITLKIAERLNKNEQNFQTATQTRESARFEKEIELLEKQNKPLPHVDFNRYSDRCEVVLSNQGLGTLIIIDWEIIVNQKTFKNFGKMLDEDFSFILKYGNENLNRLSITTGSTKKLFEAFMEPTMPKPYNDCLELIEKTAIKIKYKDIFDNEFLLEEDLREH